MDIVSITLDKYLKHRFNGVVQPARTLACDATRPLGVESQNSSNNPALRQDNVGDQSSTNGNGLEPKPALPEMTDILSDICEPDFELCTLNFDCLRPCCVAFHNRLTHIAAGFENSQIYIWTVINDTGRGGSDGFRNQIRSNECSVRLKEEVLDPMVTDIHEGRGIHEKGDKLRLGDMFRLTAHSGPVYGIEFAQDNDLMLSCSEDTTIRLWSLKSKCNLIVYRGHNYPIWSITLSPRGDYFASASMDTTARLWSFDKMCPLRMFCGHEDDVECVKFHPNAKYIATGSSDTTVRLWNISDGRMVRLMVGHQSPITSLSFFPDGKFLASSSSDGFIKVWNLATNSATNNLTVPALSSVTFSPTHEFVSTCGRDNILRVWRVGDSNFVEKTTHDFGDKFIKTIQAQFTKDNKLFIVGLRKLPAAEEVAEQVPMTH